MNNKPEPIYKNFFTVRREVDRGYKTVVSLDSFLSVKITEDIESIIMLCTLKLFRINEEEMKQMLNHHEVGHVPAMIHGMKLRVGANPGTTMHCLTTTFPMEREDMDFYIQGTVRDNDTQDKLEKSKML